MDQLKKIFLTDRELGHQNNHLENHSSIGRIDCQVHAENNGELKSKVELIQTSSNTKNNGPSDDNFTENPIETYVWAIINDGYKKNCLNSLLLISLFCLF